MGPLTEVQSFGPTGHGAHGHEGPQGHLSVSRAVGSLCISLFLGLMSVVLVLVVLLVLPLLLPVLVLLLLVLVLVLVLVLAAVSGSSRVGSVLSSEPAARLCLDSRPRLLGGILFYKTVLASGLLLPYH